MIVRDVDQSPPVPYGPSAQKRIVFGKQDGAPTFVMRVFDVMKGGSSSYHSHDFEHEVLVLKGEGVLKGDNGDMPFEEGTALFIAPNERHQLLNTGEGTLRFVCMVPLHGEDTP